MDAFQVYKDMKARTNGEIYIGVVGPVRTGKSTFIKRFMDLLVLPNMTDEHAKERTKRRTSAVSLRNNDHDNRAEICSERCGICQTVRRRGS